MKIKKRISTVILAFILSISCMSVAVYAADGNITFTDPETAVGEMVDIKCAIRSTSSEIGDVEMTLSYDSESLRFQSGDGVTDDGDGVLTFTSSGGSSEVSFTMQFQALKEGSATVSISSQTVNSGGAAMSMEEGNSTVTIGAGDPSKIEESDDSDSGSSKKKKKSKKSGDMEVTVNDTAYTLTDDFAEADIPAGYKKTTVTLDGAERQMVTNEAENIYLGYLRDSKDVGDKKTGIE